VIRFRCDSNWSFPCSHEAGNQAELDFEWVLGTKVLILWVVHTLDGIHVAKEDVIQPLNGHRRRLPLFGFLILFSFTASTDNGVIVLGKVTRVFGTGKLDHFLDPSSISDIETRQS